MTGSAPFVPTIVATLALVALHTVLAWAAARWSWLSFLVKGGRVRLVRNGERDHHAMRLAGIGDGDLNRARRTHGHTEPGEVRNAFLERNGDITLIREDQR